MSKAVFMQTRSAAKREKFYMHNSLVAVPLMLLNQSVLIDLRNETSVAGRIINVDGYMNITLEEVVFIDQKGLQYEFDEFMIPARNFRQMHLPDSVDAVPDLRRFLEAIGTKSRPPKRIENKKFEKARKRHEETVQSIIPSSRFRIEASSIFVERFYELPLHPNAIESNH